MTVVRCEKRDGFAGLASSASPTNSVSVGVDRLGHVVIENQADVLDVNTSTSHVSGHQDVLGAGLQTRQGELTLLLPFATVQRRGIVAEMGKTLH